MSSVDPLQAARMALMLGELGMKVWQSWRKSRGESQIGMPTLEEIEALKNRKSFDELFERGRRGG